MKHKLLIVGTALALASGGNLFAIDALLRASITLDTAPHQRSAAMQLEMLGFSVDGPDFIRAISTAHRPLIDLFLAAGVDVNAADDSGCTSLFAAAISQQWELAGELLKLGADAKLADDDGRTPLMAAAIRGNEAFAKTLLERGADPSAADDDGHTALHFAVIAKQPALVALLLPFVQTFADPCCKERGLFAHAVATRDWKIIEPILQKMPANLLWNSDSRALLTDAIRGRDVAHVRLLLGKHLNAPTPEGRRQPLLAYALIDDNRTAFQLLLDAGADPNTPLNTPAEKEFRDLIPKSTVREYLGSEPGMNLLMLAAGLGRSEYVKLLLERGATRGASTTSKYKLVPLYFAAWAECAEAQQLLLDGAPTPDVARIEISLGSQRAIFMKNNVPVLSTDISTGRSGFGTPEGRFVVTDKHQDHRSTIYKVPMPFFMRLSCREFGLHEGNTGSTFASHGCIRVPAEAARRLYREVPIGTLVTIGP